MSSFKRPMSAVSTKLRRKAPVHVSYGVKNDRCQKCQNVTCTISEKAVESVETVGTSSKKVLEKFDVVDEADRVFGSLRGSCTSSWKNFSDDLRCRMTLTEERVEEVETSLVSV